VSAVGWPEIIFGLLLVVVLLGGSSLYAWRQIRHLRRLTAQGDDPTSEETRYDRGRARIRLISCGLTLLLGGLLACGIIFLEGPAQRLADERDAVHAEGRKTPLTPEQEGFRKLYAAYWGTFLTVLLAVVSLAALDLWATRRFARSQWRRLRADQRAMLERQISRMRAEGNGHDEA
jgi:hypothetical protein